MRNIPNERRPCSSNKKYGLSRERVRKKIYIQWNPDLVDFMGPKKFVSYCRSLLKENIFKGLFYLSTIGGDLLLQLWLNAEFTVYIFSVL